MKSMREIFIEPDIANSLSIERFNKFVVDGQISNRLSYHRILLIESHFKSKNFCDCILHSPWSE